MVRVVINNGYGGFSLSDKAEKRLLELKGIEYIASEPMGVFKTVYYTDCEMPEKFIPELNGDSFTLSEELRAWFEEHRINTSEYNRDISRHDADLIKVVEELKEEANGSSAKLLIEEIKGNKYQITEYDGWESIETPEDMVWITAD